MLSSDIPEADDATKRKKDAVKQRTKRKKTSETRISSPFVAAASHVHIKPVPSKANINTSDIDMKEHIYLPHQAKPPFSKQSRRLSSPPEQLSESSSNSSSNTDSNDSTDSTTTVFGLDQDMSPTCVSYSVTRICTKVISLACKELFKSPKKYKPACDEYENHEFIRQRLYSIFSDDDNECKGGQFRYLLLHSYLLYVCFVNHFTMADILSQMKITAPPQKGAFNNEVHHIFRLLWEHIRIDKTYQENLEKYCPVRNCEQNTHARKKMRIVHAILDIFNYKLDLYENESPKHELHGIFPISLFRRSNDMDIRPILGKIKLLWESLKFEERKLYINVTLGQSILPFLSAFQTQHTVLSENDLRSLAEEHEKQPHKNEAHAVTLVSINQKNDMFEFKNSWQNKHRIDISPTYFQFFGDRYKNMKTIRELHFFYVDEAFLSALPSFYEKTKAQIKASPKLMPDEIAKCYKAATMRAASKQESVDYYYAKRMEFVAQLKDLSTDFFVLCGREHPSHQNRCLMNGMDSDLAWAQMFTRTIFPQVKN